jgi:hypothetical protein
MSLSSSRHAAQVAALQAELRTLRATVTELRGELAEARATAAASTVTRVPVTHVPDMAASAVSWRLPLVRAAFSPSADDPRFAGVPLDRGADTAASEIVLPEAPLLDPRLDRAAELVDKLFTSEAPAEKPADDAKTAAATDTDSRAVA